MSQKLFFSLSSTLNRLTLKMKFLPIFLLVASATSMRIGCRFNFDISWTVIGQVYTCFVTSFSIAGNSTHVVSYTGTHLTGQSRWEVKMIHFPYQNCPSFGLTIVPKGFLSVFPNFIALYFSRCPIATLSGNELKEYPNLQRFGYADSILQRVPGNLFAPTPNMRYFGFWNNTVKHVGEGIMSNLPYLEHAYFNDNTCINRGASSPTQFAGLIQALRNQCPDVATTTTARTTTRTTTTTTRPTTTTTRTTTTTTTPRTSTTTSPATTSTTKTLTTSIAPPRCEIHDFQDFVCGLDEQIEALGGGNEKIVEKVDELEAQMSELAQAVLDMSSRPCSC